MKIDPYNHKERYLKWKEKSQARISEISSFSSKLVLAYLNDMELGQNIGIGSKKGSRSYNRLNTLKDRLIFTIKKLEELNQTSKISNTTQDNIHFLFNEMRTGKISKSNGEAYKSVSDYVKVFKAFWHWWMKTNRKQGHLIDDITLDLDSKSEKPRWVYLTEQQIRTLYNNAKYEYKVLIMFLFDTGIRAPTELVNIRVSDLYNEFKELNIRDEISKTFGRKIKLMLCPELLKEYIFNNKLKSEDILFDINPSVVNRYLKRLASKVLGNGTSQAGQNYSDLTMYDFRHNSACYWLPRYPSEAGLKYRFGWKESDKIHYYTEFLGMKDNISQDNLLLDTSKTELEKRLEKSEQENDLLKERLSIIESQLNDMQIWTKKILTQLAPN